MEVPVLLVDQVGGASEPVVVDPDGPAQLAGFDASLLAQLSSGCVEAALTLLETASRGCPPGVPISGVLEPEQQDPVGRIEDHDTSSESPDRHRPSRCRGL